MASQRPDGTSENHQAVVAYFSMEIGLDPAMPTYAGGLGVLAGDTLRAAADLGLPMVGITLLHRKGYFAQHLDASGWQTETPMTWDLERLLRPVEQRALIYLEGRPVLIATWRALVRGERGGVVPVYFLDTDLPENDPDDRTLTDYLYGGDARYRLRQEGVLGLGGVEMLRMLGYDRVGAYHMNEGHAALLVLAVLEAETHGRPIPEFTEVDCEAVRDRCVFTTHTPVAAGHDHFSIELAQQVLGPERTATLLRADCLHEGELNMTLLGIHFSRHVNGVALRHAQVSRLLFPQHSIEAITNGVHAVTWTSDAFRRLFDQHIPVWRRDNFALRYAIGIPRDEVRQAHAETKAQLISEVRRRTGLALSPSALTIGFARRATAYKRLGMLFSDLERLRHISKDVGRLQIVLSGKAHPRDEQGKHLIRAAHDAARALGDDVPVVYLEGYDMDLARTVCAGVDLWLNTPSKPLEASGTSGMKAAVNGVPSFSVMDGWWVEGHVEGVTGWAIDDNWRDQANDAQETRTLYDKLEHTIVPLYYQDPPGYAMVMRWAIALNGSFFHAQRMLGQYAENTYPSLRTVGQ